MISEDKVTEIFCMTGVFAQVYVISRILKQTAATCATVFDVQASITFCFVEFEKKLMNLSEKISVIIPVYNTEKYLEKSIRSIMNQTYRNLDIICVNDGSSDSSPAILERLAAEDSRIRIINQENAGQGAARNAGLEVATSEWVTFPDSDDTLVPDAYETAAGAFPENPDMIHFSIKVVEEDGSEASSRDRKYYSVIDDGMFRISDDDVCLSDGSVSNKLFRRSLIERYGIRFEHIRYEDFQFSREYMAVAESVFRISRELYIYQRRAGSTMDETFKGSRHSIDHLKAFDTMAAFFEGNLPVERAHLLERRLFIPCYWFSVTYSPRDFLPRVVRMADTIYHSHAALREGIVRKYRYGTLSFYERKPFRHLSEMLQFLFSIRYENHDYRAYKVVRLLGMPLSKIPTARTLAEQIS